MPLIVVYNPVCGDRKGAQLTTETVLPLLTSRGLTPDKVAATEHAGHAGTLLLSYINGLTPSERAEGITLILVSGDGTLHEIVNVLHGARTEKDGPIPSLRIVLVPGGTANALHATFFPPSSAAPDAEPTLLASLLAFLSAAPRLAPLTLALTSILPEGTCVVSAVVTSTSLHAAILHDSEALRASVPGIERFKIAAAQNATTWYRARARLLGPVQRYDAASGAFVALAEEHELLGPFAYFLSTVNVDRLEQHFRIAPLQRSLPPPHGTQTMDVLVIRPLRDPSLEGKDGEAEREVFKDRIWGALGGAYQDGAHVHARYANPDGKKDGPVVVEYFRVGGWEWIPEEDDEKAHLLCADGTIFHAQKGGKISSSVLARTAHDLDIAVYA
ncbi:ATP-NAD kinase-like domain-containing protein [Lactarius akahatsu]|uniref:ATP-NAD kinase-like domain-containing protein n=1 Tax=Lactarius akahatsu TaxID=416441 RepID=A0AAD4QDD6_9AGAM|nr:ATP-NAD kinase-like domain-containing protein [Lactarius akahatsu]